MKFGENSRKGTSSLVIVMVVVVIALAGTLVYVALDKTVMTSDGYVLPGSTLTYSSLDADTGTEVYTVYGYSDGYIWKLSDGSLTNESPQDIKPIRTEIVDAPGIGRTTASVYEIDNGDNSMVVRYILNGLPFDAYIVVAGTSIPIVKLTSSDVEIGSYPQTGNLELNFESGSSTLSINRVSVSTDSNYVYEISLHTLSDYSGYYYIGDSSGIPIGMTGNTFEINKSSTTIRLTVTDSTISAVNFSGATFTPVD